MTKNDADFDTWFDTVQMTVLDKSGFDLQDRDSVQDDYEGGRDAFDVADEIAAEYM